MAKLALLVNPHAQAGRIGRVAESLAATLPSTAVYVAPPTLKALREAARAIRDRGTDVVAIAGGDGTLHAAISALHEAYGTTPMPTFAMLRGGTMNTIANTLGVPRRGIRTLLSRALAVDPYAPGSFVIRPTMQCEGHLAFLFGIGVVPAFLEAYYETGSPSPATAAKVLARAIAESRTDGPLWRTMTDQTEASIRFDEGEELGPSKVLAIAAGTVDQIGLGFRPFRRAFETTEAMHAVYIHTDASGFVRDLPRLRLARPMSPSRATDRLTRGFTISTPGPTLRYMLDGDVYHHSSGTLRVSLGPVVRFATLKV